MNPRDKQDLLLPKENIILLYKKVSGKGEIDGDFYEWLCEKFCERDPSECDGECPFF